MATKKSKKGKLAEASAKVGKTLARSTHKAEDTGRKVKEQAEKLIKDATKKAEKTVDTAVSKVKKMTTTKKKPAAKTKKVSPFKPDKKMSVEGHLGFIAGDIYEYLEKNGTTEVEKIINIMKRRKNSTGLTCGALGWLTREAKVTFSKDGNKVSLI